MKRIANSMAVRTMLYHVGGLNSIRIVDSCHYGGQNHDVLLYDGLVKNFGWKTDLPKGYSVDMIDHTSISRIDIDGGVLCITINTIGEEY